MRGGFGDWGQGFDFRPDPDLPSISGYFKERRRREARRVHYTLIRRKPVALEDVNALHALKSEIFSLVPKLRLGTREVNGSPTDERMPRICVENGLRFPGEKIRESGRKRPLLTVKKERNGKKIRDLQNSNCVSAFPAMTRWCFKDAGTSGATEGLEL
jgi:hypothetical protein